ncbi:patatin-like phospholipase family protein [Photobacterium damselae]|uniref:patatin-like phospholipase family protein n=1 Tax=Photobacterium damselae TaxID=38293 RepID=UPI00370B7BF3
MKQTTHKKNMEAYAVFEGGGVKGAALAGALGAARDNGIKFVGYGGASAGSIVAFLATIGYTPEELLKILLKYQLTDFLEDSTGDKLNKPKLWVSDFGKNKFKQAGMFISPFLYLLCSSRFREIHETLKYSMNNNGIYKTTNLEQILWKLLSEKFPEHNFCNKECPNDEYCEKKKVSFQDLYELTKIELKVIVSDVNSGQAIIFGHDNAETKDLCVISAICASSSYPIVFEPNATLSKNRLLVDGGLSCNLPSFIFNDKNHNKLPLYAFDLYKDSENGLTTYNKKNLLTFGWSLISTSLEASNAILSSIIDAIPVKVRVPNCIDTLDFNIKKIAILEMYETGKQSANESFRNDPLTSKAQLSQSSTALARALYGSDLYLNILDSILNISKLDGVVVRSWLYTSVTNDDSEIVAICWKGSEGSKFFQNEYVFGKMDSSDAYECWRTQRPVISAISKYNEGFSREHTRVCLPIFDKHYIVDISENRAQIPKKMIAVLVLEMNQSRDVCFWLNERGDALSDEFSTVIRNWLTITSKLMVSKETQYEFTS